MNSTPPGLNISLKFWMADFWLRRSPWKSGKCAKELPRQITASNPPLGTSMAASCRESQFPSSMTGRKENMLAHFFCFLLKPGAVYVLVWKAGMIIHNFCKFTNASYLQINNYCCQPCITSGLWGYYSQLGYFTEESVAPETTTRKKSDLLSSGSLTPVVKSFLFATLPANLPCLL